MFNLSNLFGNKLVKDSKLSREEIAHILKTSPEALAQFESYYQKEVLPSLPIDSDDFFGLNAKQASMLAESSAEIAQNLVTRIVDELRAETNVYVYDGHNGRYDLPCLPEPKQPVTNEDLKQLPVSMRPQLTGQLMTRDIKDDACETLLWYLSRMQKEKNPKIRHSMYCHFRQGLDILDLDPLTYEMIGTNKNSMGHWLPALVDANEGQGFFKIPKTTVAKVPMTLLQLTRTPYENLTNTTKAILNTWAYQTFDLQSANDYFVKTGTYSSKYDFRNCLVTGAKEIHELGEYLLFIHYQALQMASPLSSPCIYGVSTTNEWVVREYIHDKEKNPVIYKGLPLHTEYRVFIDCDTKEVLGIHPYWDPKVMKQRFTENRDGHDVHDTIVFHAYEDTLMSRYEANKDLVLEKVAELLPDLHLSGQWSLDIMQNDDEFWLIDMALAENSAFYSETVALEDRRPTPENWLPTLPEADNK